MNKKEFVNLTDNEKWVKYNCLNNSLIHSKVVNNNRLACIKHLNKRLLMIRNSIDYLLNHPTSKDNSYITRPHSRDKKLGDK